MHKMFQEVGDWIMKWNKKNKTIRRYYLIYWTFGPESGNQYIKGKIINQISELYYKGQNSFLPQVLSYFL